MNTIDCGQYSEDEERCQLEENQTFQVFRELLGRVVFDEKTITAEETSEALVFHIRGEVLPQLPPKRT